VFIVSIGGGPRCRAGVRAGGCGGRDRAGRGGTRAV